MESKNFFASLKKYSSEKNQKELKKLLKIFCNKKTGGARRRRIRAAPSSSPPTGERAAQGGLRPPHPGEADPAAATAARGSGGGALLVFPPQLPVFPPAPHHPAGVAQRPREPDLAARGGGGARGGPGRRSIDGALGRCGGFREGEEPAQREEGSAA